jgi:5-methylcytosine-specific restriction endonuclease McrA
VKRRAIATDVRRDVYRQRWGRCTYCCRSLRRHGFHVDHRWPLSKGGTNRRGNLQPLCARCNLRKGDRVPWVRLGVRWSFFVSLLALPFLILGSS